MTGVISLLVALAVSMIVTRIAAMALMFTGLSRESARFQARSAFSGVGFTTSEAESIVNHPVRRKIVMLLMLLGNIGVATVIGTVMISVSSASTSSWQSQLLIVSVLGLGLLSLWLVFTSRLVTRYMNMCIAWALKRFTNLDVRDYVSLLSLADGFSVSEMTVDSNHWLNARTLKDLRLSDEGILVLGIRKGKEDHFIGVPRAHDEINAGDTIIVYGQISRIENLDHRQAGGSGDKQHKEAVKEQVRTELKIGTQDEPADSDLKT